MNQWINQSMPINQSVSQLFNQLVVSQLASQSVIQSVRHELQSNMQSAVKFNKTNTNWASAYQNQTLFLPLVVTWCPLSSAWWRHCVVQLSPGPSPCERGSPPVSWRSGTLEGWRNQSSRIRWGARRIPRCRTDCYAPGIPWTRNQV